jgi:hypothetical protein
VPATALLRLSSRPHQPATEGLVRRRFAWHRCCCALGAPTGKRLGAARKFESSQTDETHTVEGGPSSRAGQKAEGVAQDGGGEQLSGAAFRADAVMILRWARPLTLLSLSLPLSPSLSFAVMPAVVVRQRKTWRRVDGGMFIYFEDNAGVIVNAKGDMKGSAISGPVAKECADLWPRIASAAGTVL